MADLNPFSRESIESTALGPFAKKPIDTVALGQVGPDDVAMDVPLATGLGFTPEEVRRQLDHVPGFSEVLERPEADTLRQYLQGSDKYDMETLNRLVLRLTDDVSRANRSPKTPEAPRQAAGPVARQIQRVLPPEEPDPSITVRDTGPWWLKS